MWGGDLTQIRQKKVETKTNQRARNPAVKQHKCECKLLFFDLKYVSKCVLADPPKRQGQACRSFVLLSLSSWQDKFPKPKMKNWAQLQITLQVCWKTPTCPDDIKQTRACFYDVYKLLLHWRTLTRQRGGTTRDDPNMNVPCTVINTWLAP